MKPPDEIKKGLEKCSNSRSVCDECEFSNSNAGKWKELMGCALALIQQLQHNNAQLAIDKAKLAAENAEKDARIRQLEAERDAAVENIRGDCVYCLHLCEDMVAPSCFDCANKGFYRWEWRGLPKEE